MTGVPWKDLAPNIKNAWLTEGLEVDFDDLLPIGSKETKTQQNLEVKAIFKNYGGGVKTNRDEWTYDFTKTGLTEKIRKFIINFNDELKRWKQRPDKKVLVDDFVNYDDTKYKWSEGLKSYLTRGIRAEFDEAALQLAMFRPFCKQWHYFDKMLVERMYQMPRFVPASEKYGENDMICVSGLGSSKPFQSLMLNIIGSLDLLEKTQCFPLYTYALDGKIRRDNVTDWALAQFQEKYGPEVTKRDIFHYVYALLHHPEYRERYKENLKRELPRIPLVGEEEAPTPSPSPASGRGVGEETAASVLLCSPLPLAGAGVAARGGGGGSPFQTFVDIGAKLAALHVGYEQAAEYDLRWVENKDLPFSWRVAKMKLAQEKTALIVNPTLTLEGIPPEAFAYKLGNRSALEWVIDQYQVSVDKRSGIVSDPNRADQPDYIVRLVGRVITVSLETVQLVAALPGLAAGEDETK